MRKLIVCGVVGIALCAGLALAFQEPAKKGEATAPDKKAKPKKAEPKKAALQKGEAEEERVTKSAVKPCADCKEGDRGYNNPPCYCPLYMYADHGTYQSYYALTCMYGPPISLDGVDLTPTPCADPCTGSCVSVGRMKYASTPNSNEAPIEVHPGSKDLAFPNKQDPVNNLNVKKDAKQIGHFFVEFKQGFDDKETVRVVELFLVLVQPRKQDFSLPPVIFGVGHEIDGDKVAVADRIHLTRDEVIPVANTRKFVRINFGGQWFQAMLADD